MSSIKRIKPPSGNFRKIILRTGIFAKVKGYIEDIPPVGTIVAKVKGIPGTIVDVGSGPFMRKTIFASDITIGLELPAAA